MGSRNDDGMVASTIIYLPRVIKSAVNRSQFNMGLSLRSILSEIRGFLYGGAVQLPLTIAGTFLIIGFFTANYAMLFFLVGFLILVPASIHMILNPIFGWILNFIPSVKAMFTTKGSDICGIMPTFKTMSNTNQSVEETNTFSLWSAMIAFFVGYLLTNAVSLINHEQPANQISLTTSENKNDSSSVPKRNVKVIGGYSVGLIVLVVLFLFFVRIQSACESIGTTIASIALFGYFGHGWYLAMASMGEERVSDLFGVANRLLPPSAITNGPIACIPFSS